MNLTFISTDGTPLTISVPEKSPPLLSVDFTGVPDGIVTNEFAHWNPKDPKSKISPVWDMDSGSLFCKAGFGWSGVPDDKSVDALSSSGTNSSIFRLITKRKDFLDVSVKMTLSINSLTSTPSTPAVDWDGIHQFLRYQSETSLYYVSVCRRDGTSVIKKKVPGGPSNGGTYFDLSAYTPRSWAANAFQSVETSIKTLSDGSVLIALQIAGKEVLRAVDDGKVGGAPIKTAGSVGIRGDNANFTFNNFQVI